MNETNQQPSDNARLVSPQSGDSGGIAWPMVLLGVAYISALGIAYAFGLFEMIGPGLLQSVDKIGLFGHLAFYGGLYGVVALLLTAVLLLVGVVVFLVFRLFGIGFQIPPMLPVQAFLVCWAGVVIVDIVAFILVVPVVLGVSAIWLLVRVAGGSELGRLAVAGLLPMLAFGIGLLNGVQIADAPASIQISLKGNPTPVPGQIVMSTGQGLVFFNKNRGEAIYLPHGSVELASATESQLERMNDNRTWAKSLIVQFEEFLTEYGWSRVKGAFDQLRGFIKKQFEPQDLAPQEQTPRRIG